MKKIDLKKKTEFIKNKFVIGKSSSDRKVRQWLKKHKKKIPGWSRTVIQILFFLFFPSAFTAAFSGVKYIAGQVGRGEQIEITSFVMTLVMLCIFTMIFGRFFCGFACAFGSLGDWVRGIYLAVCKKIKKKPYTIPTGVAAGVSVVKYAVLAIILILSFMGVYAKLRGSSPWDVFSMLHAGNFALGGYAAGILLLILIVIGMCVQERFFCRFLCPMGAVFSMLPILPFFSLRRDRKQCIPGCSACTRRCPADIELPEDGSVETKGDCFMCQKCIGTCPKENIHCGGIHKLKGNEIWFTLLRAAALLGIYLWLGI